MRLVDFVDRNIPTDLIAADVKRLPMEDVWDRLDEHNPPSTSVVRYEMDRWEGQDIGECQERLLCIRLSALDDADHPWHDASLTMTGSPERRVERPPVHLQKDFKGKTLDDIELRDDVAGLDEAVKAAAEYIQFLRTMADEGINMAFCGPTGVGKSLLAGIIANAARRNGVMSQVITMQKYLEGRMPNAIDKETSADAMAVKLLVLDELGAERVSDWTISELDRLLSFRYDNKLPTIITSNISWKDMAAGLPPHLVDRLQERCRVLELDGPSYRGKG